MIDFYRDQYGATVALVQTLRGGDVVRRTMPPLDAAIEAQAGERNGFEVASCHIEFGLLVDGYGSSA